MAREANLKNVLLEMRNRSISQEAFLCDGAEVVRQMRYQLLMELHDSDVPDR